MASFATFRVAFVTAPDMKIARRIIHAALNERLIACANIFPKVESHYRWRGKTESSNEVLMILKTTKSRLIALEHLVISKHPYDTPEFIVLSVDAGNRRYLKWLAGNCT